jgi:hypothetical protein
MNGSRHAVLMHVFGFTGCMLKKFAHHAVESRAIGIGFVFQRFVELPE